MNQPGETLATTVGPPSLSTTASVTTFGSLAWIGWVWLIAAIVFTGILVAVGVWGELDESLWHTLGAGMQRWLFLVVGFTMVSEFGRMFLTNGVTRAQLARSALVTMLALSALGALFATLVYAAEGVVFDIHDWPHRIDETLVDGPGELGRIYIDNLLTVAAFFTSGWLLGACYRSRERDEANLLAIPCLFPAAAAQILLRGDAALFGFLDRLDLDTPVALGMGVTAAVTALGAVAADHLTRQYVL